MEHYIKVQDLLDKFERGLNPLPDVEQGAALLVRLAGADQTRLEARFKLYVLALARHRSRVWLHGL